MMKWIFLFLSSLALFADPPIESPEQIETELEGAEEEFDRAKKMFNPWYTGPLITPSPSMAPQGSGLIQPYIYAAGNYARYNAERTAVSIPNLIQLRSSNVLQFGVTQTVDCTSVYTAAAQWQDGKSGGGFGDIPVNLGFLVNSESLYWPQIKFNIQETFPTGRYQKLSSNGLALNGLGQGSYQTQFGLGIGKLLFWSTQHPLNTRLFVSYNIPTPVHVKGFNVYGGGYGTHGTVRLGNTFTADFGLELSLTQRWVIALDTVYVAENRTKFQGDPGVLAGGAPASVGSGFSDNLSFAPAFEYNWSDKLGMVAGAWFSVYGRNSLAFAQGAISFYWMFP